jgi:hypothetical protein
MAVIARNTQLDAVHARARGATDCIRSMSMLDFSQSEG